MSWGVGDVPSVAVGGGVSMRASFGRVHAGAIMMISPHSQDQRSNRRPCRPGIIEAFETLGERLTWIQVGALGAGLVMGRG